MADAFSTGSDSAPRVPFVCFFHDRSIVNEENAITKINRWPIAFLNNASTAATRVFALSGPITFNINDLE